MSRKAEIAAYNQANLINARMPGGDRRRQIVKVAVSLFSQRGFRGTTTKEIAQAVGVSEAIIFRHFATKVDLYSAILDYKACDVQMGDLREIVGEAYERKDDRAVFEGLARAMLEHHAEDTEFLRLLLYSALEGHELAQMFWDRHVCRHTQLLCDYVRERQRDGALREMNPLIVVRGFFGMIIHHTFNNTLWDKSRRMLNISDEEAARSFADLLMCGIITTGAPAGAAKLRADLARKNVRQSPRKKKQSS